MIAGDHRPFPELRESHVDMLLVEELSCNREFSIWFATKCGLSGDLSHAAASVWDGGRESDIIALFEGNGVQAALIENKIRSKLSEGQADHYRVRGRNGRDNGLWDRWVTVLVSPQEWVDRYQLGQFDIHVSYEEIGTFLAGLGSERSAWRASIFLSQATPQKHRFTMSDRQTLGIEAEEILKRLRA